jgi:aldehyde dehydrogenase (NAD+)
MIYQHDRLPIGGEMVVPSTGRKLDVHSPSTEDRVGSVPEAVEADVDRAVAAARHAFDSSAWSDASTEVRSKILEQAAANFRERREEIATILAHEVGLPLHTDADRQVGNAIAITEYMARLALTFPFEETREGLARRVLVRREPVGVVAAIAPWNAPLFLSVCKIASAIAAGCTVVLKPSPETPLNAYALYDVFAGAGLPAGVLNVVPADRQASEYLVRHPGVDKVSFTGSTSTGRRIAELCGADLRRVTLELGGKSAAILLDDADLDVVIGQLSPMTTMNNGQTCINQTRILVPHGQYARVVDGVTEAYRSMRMGDPFTRGTDLGPLISAGQRARVEGYIESGRDQGARLTIGGGRPESLDKGWYVEPTVFADVDNSMKIAREEIFGPVVSIIPYATEDEAVALANDSTYGLSGTVWTADDDRGLRVARRIRSGTVGVNGLEGDLAAPFGGFKHSGIGREFGPEGLAAFCEYQSIGIPG